MAASQKAEANYEELKNGSRPEEISASEAEFHAAEADREHLKADLDRAEMLRKSSHGGNHGRAIRYGLCRISNGQSALSPGDEALRIGKDRPAQEEVAQAKAAMEQAQAQYRLIKEGPRKRTSIRPGAKVAQAKATVQNAETKLGYATVCSPLTGVVLSKNTEPGEYVAAGTPVVTVADIENLWLRAYVDDLDLGKGSLKQGAEAEITTDAYPNKIYKGRVSFISEEQEFTPKTVQTNHERVKFVYRIKIDVKNTDRDLKPGMPADAKLMPPKN